MLQGCIRKNYSIAELKLFSFRNEAPFLARWSRGSLSDLLSVSGSSQAARRRRGSSITASIALKAQQKTLIKARVITRPPVSHLQSRCFSSSTPKVISHQQQPLLHLLSCCPGHEVVTCFLTGKSVCLPAILLTRCEVRKDFFYHAKYISLIHKTCTPIYQSIIFFPLHATAS